MNKLTLAATAAMLMSSAASAADFGVVQVETPMVYTAPAADWTGFYAGIFGGVASADAVLGIDEPNGPGFVDIGISGGGAIGGVQIGADWQMNNVVFGAVADIALTNVAASINLDTNLAGPPISGEISSQLTYLGTVRARVGFLPTDNLLAYVHGGFAAAGTEQTASFQVGGPGGAGGSYDDFEDPTHYGYTVGAGFEYMVTDSISLQTEYAYTNLGEQTIATLGGTDITQTVDMHTVKAGVNFRF